MYELRNHTPHEITLVLPDGTRLHVAPTGVVPRNELLREDEDPVETMHGTVARTVTRVTGRVLDLPPAEPGVLRIVSRGVAEAVRGRSDLVFPDRQIRDERGRVVEAHALGRVVTPPAAR